MKNLKKDDIKKNVIELLTKYDVPYDKWGTGDSETMDHLVMEIKNSVTELIENNGQLWRQVTGSAIQVFCATNKKTYLLYEQKQVFNDGREKIREIPMSIGRKMKKGEDPLKCAKRVLKEELGINEKIEIKDLKEMYVFEKQSQSYPGLMNIYNTNFFEVTLPESLYNPDGYIEETKEKKTYFKWKLTL